MKKIAITLISILLILALFGGCTSPATESEAASPSSSASASAVENSAAPSSAEPSSSTDAEAFTPSLAPFTIDANAIYFGISTGATSAGWRDECSEEMVAVLDEYQAAGKIKGYKIVNNVTNGDALEQGDIIRSFITDPDVNVIAINANDAAALNGVIAEAQEAGKLVYTYDSGVTAPGVLNVSTDQYKRFYLMTDTFCQALGGKGTIFEVQGIEGHMANTDRVNAAAEALAKYPDIDLTTIVTGGWNQETGKQVTAQVLASGTKFDGIISQDAEAYGVLSACIDANKIPKVMVGETSVAFFKLWKQLRDSGADFKVITAANPPGIGATGIRLAYQLASGKTFKPGTLVENNTYLYQVLALYTDENFDEAWAKMEGKPDNYQMSEQLSEDAAVALFE